MDKNLDEFLQKYEALIKSKVHTFIARNPTPGIVSYQEDLLQAGYIGLMQAYRSFDSNYGVPEIAYVSMRVDYVILQEFDRLNPLSSRQIAQQRRLQESKCLIDSLYKRPTTRQELADWEGISVGDLESLIKLNSRQFVSIDDDFVQAKHKSESVAVARIYRKERAKALLELSLELSKRDKTIIKLLYIDGLSLSQAGKVLGIRKQSVARARDNMLKRLKAKLEDSMIYEDL